MRGRSPRETGTLALKDVSFEIEEGESYAIIGPNGAGKSTALKLISRISYPTSGRVRIRGRVAALIPCPDRGKLTPARRRGGLMLGGVSRTLRVPGRHGPE